MAVTYEKTLVSPALADAWLRQNERNRKIGAARVDRYSRDMASGSWMMTAEPIKFDTNNKLIDGQHRLLAIKQSGCSIEMVVARGVDPKAQDVMDTGAPRTAADVASLHDYKNTSVLMSIARVLASEPALGMTPRYVKAPTNSELLRFVEDHPTVVDAAGIAGRLGKTLGLPASTVGACWTRLAEQSPDGATEFFESLVNMDFDGDSDPRAVLRRRLAKDPHEFRNRMVAISAVLRTWNAWRAGEQWSRISLKRDNHAIQIPEYVF